MMQSSGSTAKFAELGSLIAQSDDESQFVGSSSGVFFVNTVRQAFAKSFSDPSTASTPKFPAAEDTLVGSTESISVGDQASASPGHVGGNYQPNWIYDPRIAQNLGEAPDLSTARQLMMVYFKIWHPVFPFLHGPTFLRAMEAFFLRGDTNDTFHSSSMSEHHRACWTAIFQSVFNMSTFLRPDLELASESKIKTPVNALNLANVILMRHDILSLQAMLAVQLYLVASMSLRPASLLGGSILRAALHAGFHRCPYRFQQFTTHERQLRKRIFWCVYAIDRYLSQALGLPLGIQDSDTDVCQPGSREIHSPQDPRSSFLKSTHVLERSERMHDDKLQGDSADNMSGADYGISLLPNLEQNREATLAGFVTYGRLVGRALELFHKSINNREIHQSAVLYLVSDVHKWWNNLSPSLQTVSTQTTQVSEHDSSSSPPALGSFFSVLYKHLILCINRPCLSLEPSSADFCSAIQICIDAARSIISLLKAQLTNGEPFFWPNLLSAAYMSGLVIAFACQLRQYSTFKGCQEMRDCLEIMQSMPRQWNIARHCHTALSILLLNIERRSVGDEIPGSKRAVQSDSTYLRGSTTKVKRPRTTDNEAGRSEQSIGNNNNNNNNNNEEPSFILNATVDSSIHISSREEEEEEFSETAAATFVPGMQWLDEPSFVSTNFDLNMTNLFGDSSAWDPMLFEAFDLEYSQDPVR